MFKVNDKVQVLDDDFEGIVVSTSGLKVSVKDKNGFILEFSESELIPIVSTSIKEQMSYVPESAIAQKDTEKSTPSPRLRPQNRNQPVLEVDLHIHKITNSERGLSNYEMLNLQLDTAQHQLEFAIKKRIQKVVFIHGVGEGVLREELYTLFRRFENIKYYDAEFQKYGAGATEVYVYQNPKN